LINLFKTIKIHSKTHIGLQPPVSFGMKTTLNSKSCLICYSNNGYYIKVLNSFVNKSINCFFVARYFKWDAFKLD
jgi:hypothetical protein